MNATKWPSLMIFAQFLGREGICRVEENEKGLHVAWIDNSPENLRRQDAIRKKERQDRGDEEREQAAIREQVRRAKMDTEERGEGDLDEGEGELKRAEGEKIKLSFGTKSAVARAESSATPVGYSKESPKTGPSAPVITDKEVEVAVASPEKAAREVQESLAADAAPAKVSLKMSFQSKPKNVFAAAKKNTLGGKKAAAIEQPKKMSEAERIMKEELEQRRKRGPSSFGGPAQKKQRF